MKKLISLKEMRLIERVEAVLTFIYSQGNLFNKNLKQYKFNPILVITVKEQLENIKQLIEEDIKNIKIKDVNAVDVFERNINSEISEFIFKINNYNALHTYGNKYKKYKENLELDKTYPKANRIEDIQTTEEKIKRLQQTIENYKNLDIPVHDLKVQLDYEKRKCDCLYKTLENTSLDDLNKLLFEYARNYFIRLLNEIDEKIEFLGEHIYGK